MATDKEYKAVIDALSGECERLHKENEKLKKALENHDTFMKYSYEQGKQDALSQEPCDDAVSRAKAIENVVQIAKTFANSDKQKAMCGRIIFMLEHMSEVSEMITEEYYKPCSLCHNADCVWMGGKDTHKLCEDFQALSQEPTVTSTDEPMTMVYPTIVCDDAISRKDIQDYIAKYLSQYLYEDVRQAVEVIDTYIGDMPSVTQKSGKWITVTNGRGGHECSLCHEYAPSYQSGDEYLTKYCPNCGAKMDESEDKE